MKTPEEYLEEHGIDVSTLEEQIILFKNPDYTTAIIGITDDNRVVYNYNKMIEWLINEENMTYNEAIDFIDYNNSFSYGNGKMPLIMFPLKDTN